jgi:hypothetical protein
MSFIQRHRGHSGYLVILTLVTRRLPVHTTGAAEHLLAVSVQRDGLGGVRI